MSSQPEISWKEIEAECGDFRSGFVATFRKYEGQVTDEKDPQGRFVKVTKASFARHIGVAHSTFERWIKDVQRGHTARPQRSKNDLTRDVKRALRDEPEAVLDAIKDAPAPVRKMIRTAALKEAVDEADVPTLSRATADASKNRQVERNRQRAAEGDTSKSDRKPSIMDAESAAFLTTGKFLGGAGALGQIRQFREWWSTLPEEVRKESDLVDSINERFDLLEMALTASRSEVNGNSDFDEELAEMLRGRVSRKPIDPRDSVKYHLMSDVIDLIQANGPMDIEMLCNWAGTTPNNFRQARYSLPGRLAMEDRDVTIPRPRLAEDYVYKITDTYGSGSVADDGEPNIIGAVSDMMTRLVTIYEDVGHLATMVSGRTAIGRALRKMRRAMDGSLDRAEDVADIAGVSLSARAQYILDSRP